jgi:hypothetical protein
MESEPRGLALVVVGLCFVAFLLFKLFRPSRAKSAEWHQAKRLVADAKRRARDRGADPAKRAAAWREAALSALEGLDRPSLAASYARRAERLAPDDSEAVGLLALSLRRASRFRALERFLWRRLAGGPDDESAGYERAFNELLKLYEGPLRRPETADALRRMRGRR